MKEAEINKNKFFILDFHVRWNSTLLMIKRFKEFNLVVNSLTTYPNTVAGISKIQIKKLKENHINNQDWETIDTLEKIMNPFYEVTKILSGKKYPTLSIALMAYNFLKKFLNKHPIDTENNLEVELKKILLDKLEFHFSKKLSLTQNKITMVKI